MAPQENAQHVNSILSLIYETKEQTKVYESYEAKVVISFNSEDYISRLNNKKLDTSQHVSNSQESLSYHLHLNGMLLLN